MEYRIEKDSIGEKQVPVDAYYGVQSMRGCENFHITGQRMQPEFINSMAEIKKHVQSATVRLASWMLRSKMQSARLVTRSSLASSMISSCVTQSRVVQAQLQI